MKKIQILGPGCAKCLKLTEAAETAARQWSVPYELEKVTQMDRILGFGVMMTPALVVDGEVKSVGRIPSAAELKDFLGA
jgi:small redox-active disulfide protein 2